MLKFLTFTGLCLTSCLAFADFSYNLGYASEYHYRGIFQKESSASAGIDYENTNGIYAGLWTADVGDGLEVDAYFGYTKETKGVTTSIGATTYQYTGDFDDTYNEINLNLGYKMAHLEHSIGKWDGFGNSQDYSFTAITIDFPHNIYTRYGRFNKDFEGDYYEIGHNTQVYGLDLGISAIFSSKELSSSDESLVFTMSKTF